MSSDYITVPAPGALERALEATRRLIDAGDLPGAVREGVDALKRGLRAPLFFNLLAFELENAGRLTEAFGALQHALELDPDDPQTLHAVGLCLFKLGRLREAVVAYDAALSRRPDFAPTLYHRGVALEGTGDEAAARASYLRAADVAPSWSEPAAGLASLAARDGDAEGARRWATAALDLDPTSLMGRLALASAELLAGAPEAAETVLRAALADSRIDANDRSVAFGRLGDALHALGRRRDALDAWAAGKAAGLEANRDVLKRAPRLLDEARGTARALSAGGAFDRSPSGSGDLQGGLRGLAFLVGFPRSGTTLLEQVLATHPDALHLEERPFLELCAEDFLGSRAGLERLRSLEPERALALRERYWTLVGELGLPTVGRVLLDKHPLNTLKLPLVARLFPSATVLFAVRDPRDVVFSCFRRSFRMNAGMREFATLEGAVAFYDAVMTMAEAARAKLPLTLHEVRYERLVEDFEGEAGAAARAIGLSWNEAMRNFAEASRERAISTPSAGQVRRGLYREGVGQWRPYAAELKRAFRPLQPWVERFGYA